MKEAAPNREVVLGSSAAPIPGQTEATAGARVLTLPLKAEYFDAIRDGTKPEEYRLLTPYWRKRLEGRSYDSIVLTKGYPARDDLARRLVRPWRGYRTINLTHPHFGPDPVEVFAIDVARTADSAGTDDRNAGGSETQ